MQKKPQAIYVITPFSGVIDESTGDWQVVRWDGHPALFPRGLVVYTVSTQAGDVELHIPYPLSKDKARVMWAFNQVEQLHPKPNDMDWVEALPTSQMLCLALKLALEYVELSEDGRGHNARSRYIAHCIRHLEDINSEEGSESYVDAN